MGKIKVCLDAGHSNKYNCSPAVSTYYESVRMWDLHLLLKKELESFGVEVILTRQNISAYMDVCDRGAASKGCDLFLSLHTNAVGSGVNESVDYVAVYHLTEDSKTNIDEQSKSLANALAPVIAQVMSTKNSSKVLSRKASSDRNKDGVLNDNYYGVLHGARKVGTPGLIIEHSFHTNTRSTLWLMDDDNLTKIARAEAKVIAEYFGISTNKYTNDNGFKPYVVKVTASVLNIRSGAGTSYAINGQIKDRGAYTIVEEKNGWGRLKSGAGWICLDYTKKI